MNLQLQGPFPLALSGQYTIRWEWAKLTNRTKEKRKERKEKRKSVTNEKCKNEVSGLGLLTGVFLISHFSFLISNF